MKKEMWKKGMGCCLVLAVILAGLLPNTVSAQTKLSKTSANLCVGETCQLKLSGSGVVQWSSNKKSVATVDGTGLVTAKKTGNCVITAKKSGKKYTCKVTVKKLPSNYATVDGKKVKVGNKVTLTYSLTSKTPIADISIRYYYDRDALKVTNTCEERFKIWLANVADEPLESDGEVYDRYQLWGYSEADSFNANPINCEKAKVVDKMQIKVLKSGNYSVKAVYECRTNEGKDIKNFKLTEVVK